MIIYVLFAQRREDHPGQHTPETLAVADEFAVRDGDVDLEKFTADIVADWDERYSATFDETFVAHKWVVVNLGNIIPRIRGLLLEIPTIEGKIEIEKRDQPWITVQEGAAKGTIVDPEEW